MDAVEVHELADDQNSERAEPTKEQTLKKQNTLADEAMNKRKAKYLKDFNEKSDVCETMDDEEMAKLGRYARFEKSFPFYKMDVNGFMVLIRRAMRITYKDEPEK